LRLPDLPQHHKQAALERVLINFGNQPEELNLKLSALVRNWSAPPASAKPSTWQTMPHWRVPTRQRQPTARTIAGRCGSAPWLLPSSMAWNRA
jgi:hypothetical protein